MNIRGDFNSLDKALGVVGAVEDTNSLGEVVEVEALTDVAMLVLLFSGSTKHKE